MLGGWVEITHIWCIYRGCGQLTTVKHCLYRTPHSKTITLQCMVECGRFGASSVHLMIMVLWQLCTIVVPLSMRVAYCLEEVGQYVTFTWFFCISKVINFFTREIDL